MKLGTGARWLAFPLVCAVAVLTAEAAAEPREVDRVVVRFSAPELGGERSPRFVSARMLAFEARLEAFADPDRTGTAYRERHVTAALERHISETLLAGLRIDTDTSAEEVRVLSDTERR
jgi:hypothetical protein